MKRSEIAKRAVAVGMTAGILVLSGCVGYKLGSTLPPGIKTVHVPTFLNRTGQAQIEVETTQATIREMQQDGTLRVGGADNADAVLKVTLVSYELEPLRYEKDRRRTAREYRAKITAELEFTPRGAQEPLVKKTVQGESTFIPSGGLSSSKRRALPTAARDLAHDIVESVVEYW